LQQNVLYAGTELLRLPVQYGSYSPLEDLFICNNYYVLRTDGTPVA